MSSVRPMVQDVGGLARAGHGGDLVVTTNTPLVISAAGAYTLVVAAMARGAVVFTGLTAGANLTTDTAANILAAFPNLDVGESVVVEIGIEDAFALTLVAGAGVTLAGCATIAASSKRNLYFTKTSATTVTCTVV